MPDRLARGLSVLAILIAGGTFLIDYRSYQQSVEQLSVDINRAEFDFSDDYSAIVVRGELDLYNPSTLALTVSRYQIGNGISYTSSAPPEKSYSLANCRQPDFSPTIIEPRSSIVLPFFCEITGSVEANKFLEEYAKPGATLNVSTYLRKLYSANGTDFFDNELPEDLNGTVIDISDNQRTDEEYGTTTWVPVAFYITTRNNNFFEKQIYIYLGASNYM